MNDFYLFFLIIMLILIVVSFYILYIQSKLKKFDSFNSKICPNCKSSNVEIERLRGDCATSEYKFICNTCGYKSTHNISNSSGCGSSCKPR